MGDIDWNSKQIHVRLSLWMGHSSIQITLDVHGHLFNDAEFNRQQVDLSETDLNSVRKSLENSSELD